MWEAISIGFPVPIWGTRPGIQLTQHMVTNTLADRVKAIQTDFGDGVF